MRFTYKERILLYFSIIIAVFTAGVILFERQQVKQERTLSLERMLDIDAEIIYNYLKKNTIYDGDSIAKVEELLKYMSPDLRVTIVDFNGNVLYDNRLSIVGMENHLQRPEIQKAIGLGTGSNIRLSETTDFKYLYYAKKFEDELFIRVALPYNLEIQSFINSQNSFASFILLFFLVCVALMLYFANRFSKSIKQLREFSLKLKSGQTLPASFNFPDDEAGIVSAAIAENYNLLQENKRKLYVEREKLLQHFHYSEEGIAIFSKERKKIYANSHFLQFLNIIMDEPALEVESVFTYPDFEDFIRFLDSSHLEGNMFTKRIEKNGKKFNVRIIVFDDKSFELYISDITKSEKTRLLKQEMTNNIAHELRTPVTSMRGYLETLLNLNENDTERRNNFLEKAYIQSIRLSELIQDISMLTKIEEASDKTEKEPVRMVDLLKDLGADMEEKLNEKQINFRVDVSENVLVYGSPTLLYSIFRNLTENSLTYGGENIDIVVRCYMENDDAYYFEFYDTGVGVEEKHLVRIFERFYRINKGRTRNTGGSGLGLSIVKNAVLFHNGSIVAKNRSEGGLSFLFTFPKKETH